MKTYAFRLRPGQDLKNGIQEFIATRELRAATLLTCVGSLTQASIRLSNQPSATAFHGRFEIVSLVGTASATGGAHLHIAISDETGKTIGGHLMEGSLVFTTAEIVLGELDDIEFLRALDPATGYKELQVLPMNPTVNWKKEITLSVDAAIAKLTQTLQAEGFGILTRIDMHSKMKEKLGKEMPTTVILGACHPALAFEAATINMDVTSLMPCNVVARDVGGGKTSVEFARATPILATLKDSKLDRIAQEADARLERAFKAV